MGFLLSAPDKSVPGTDSQKYYFTFIIENNISYSTGIQKMWQETCPLIPFFIIHLHIEPDISIVMTNRNIYYDILKHSIQSFFQPTIPIALESFISEQIGAPSICSKADKFFQAFPSAHLQPPTAPALIVNRTADAMVPCPRYICKSLHPPGLFQTAFCQNALPYLYPAAHYNTFHLSYPVLPVFLLLLLTFSFQYNWYIYEYVLRIPFILFSS